MKNHKAPPLISASAPESPGLEELFSRLSEESSFFALLDGASMHMDVQALYGDGLELLPLFPACSDDPHEKHFAMPWLLRIQGEDMTDRIQGWLGKGCASFLVSRADPDELRHHLQGLLHAFIPDSEKPVWFRIYDPLVLRTFLKCGAAHNTSLFWKTIIHECWVEMIPDKGEKSTGEDYSAPFYFEKYTAPEGIEVPDEAHIRFTPGQMQAFEEARQHFMLVQACRLMAQKISPRDEYWPELRGLMDSAVEKAFSYGLASQESINSYVECCLVFGWNFVEELPDTQIIASPNLPGEIKQNLMQTLLQNAVPGNISTEPDELNFSDD